MQKTFNPATTRQSYNNYLKSLKKTGAIVVSTLDLATQVDEENDLHFFFKRDIHWTPFAARITAQRIAEVMKKEAGYTPDSKTEFETEVSGKMEMKGVMYAELQQLCTDTLPSEITPGYNTTLKAGKGEDALFGDSGSTPPIVLTGSSFSWMSIINFEGFLAEALQHEIANFAIPAGALFNALTSYVSLPKEQKLNPPYLVWEHLANYNLNQGERMFRQIIPAIYNECSAEDALATGTLSVEAGKGGILFSLPEALKVSGSDYYLFLNTDNLGLAKFTLEMEYADGDGEWFTIDRSDNFNNAGRFFVELTNEIDSPLVKVTLSGMEDVKATVEARLCKIPKQQETKS